MLRLLLRSRLRRAARLLADDAHVRQLTAQCLFITGFIQFGFASATRTFDGRLDPVAATTRRVRDSFETIATASRST